VQAPPSVADTAKTLRIQKNMKALVFKRYGKPDQVAFADIPRPAPGQDEILVQVYAAGLNRSTT
jgi:D-arabinose 1-dehydrogenase-like Zn-dependent alcohol dehydrogenase